MSQLLSPKQLEFVIHSTERWNFAHGSVRAGKTECTLFRFMQAVYNCPDSNIAMIGHTSTTIYQNAIRLLLEGPRFDIYRPFLTWFPTKRELRFKDKVISTIGAKDEGSVGLIQGRTLSLVYCDEMTLYPESVINMIDTRLSLPHSTGFASMNPKHPDHILKQWIDAGNEGKASAYSLHFTMDDNPFLSEEYKEQIKNNSSGLFYKRHYLGLWCLAEGAVYDCFDRKTHVIGRGNFIERKPCAEYWIAGIDYGVSNPFACVLVGVNTGREDQMGKRLWVEKEYFWDPKKKGRQKTNTEFAKDIYEFLEPYGVKKIYIDPSAESFQLELQRLGMHPIHAYNDVENGIQRVADAFSQNRLYICPECPNLLREIEGYVWDSKSAREGYDAPLKKDDHCADALRYAIATHKVSSFDQQEHYRRQEEFLKSKYHGRGYGFRQIG